jgi:hypothetical protein
VGAWIENWGLGKEVGCRQIVGCVVVAREGKSLQRLLRRQSLEIRSCWQKLTVAVVVVGCQSIGRSHGS